MALPTTISAQGATLTLGTSSWAARITGFSIGSRTRTAKKVTNLSTTTAHQYKPGTLVEPGVISCTIQYDPSDPIPITAAAETFTITWPVAAGDSTGATLAGTGFITSEEISGEEGDDDEATARVEIQFDGNTGPTFTAGS